MKITDITDITDFIENYICRIMVGCSRCTYIHRSFRLRWHWRSRSVARRGHVQAFTQKSRSRSVDRAAHIQAFTQKLALTLSRSRSVARRGHVQAFTQKLALTLSRSRSVARRARVQACAQKSPCLDTFWRHRPSLPPPKKNLFFFTVWEAWAGHTWRWTRGICFYYKTQRGPAPLRTSAARRASSCTTAPASCRRPGTRTGCRSGRNPTPGAQLAAMSDQNRAFGQKADWTCDPPHKKKGTFNYRNISSEGIIMHYSCKINSEKSKPHEITDITVFN